MIILLNRISVSQCQQHAPTQLMFLPQVRQLLYQVAAIAKFQHVFSLILTLKPFLVVPLNLCDFLIKYCLSSRLWMTSRVPFHGENVRHLFTSPRRRPGKSELEILSKYPPAYIEIPIRTTSLLAIFAICSLLKNNCNSCELCRS